MRNRPVRNGSWRVGDSIEEEEEDEEEEEEEERGRL